MSPILTIVSIHAPARGATTTDHRECQNGCFNSRAREGRDEIAVGNLFLHLVSIHAPARGATFPPPVANELPKFQFTRPRGARPVGLEFQASNSGFNSRAREGRDALGLADHKRADVSIHAPARGATSFPPPFPEVRRFNSRAREGRDI